MGVLRCGKPHWSDELQKSVEAAALRPPSSGRWWDGKTPLQQNPPSGDPPSRLRSRFVCGVCARADATNYVLRHEPCPVSVVVDISTAKIAEVEVGEHNHNTLQVVRLNDVTRARLEKEQKIIPLAGTKTLRQHLLAQGLPISYWQARNALRKSAAHFDPRMPFFEQAVSNTPENLTLLLQDLQTRSFLVERKRNLPEGLLYYAISSPEQRAFVRAEYGMQPKAFQVRN